jgi:hypothetical protein
MEIPWSNQEVAKKRTKRIYSFLNRITSAPPRPGKAVSFLEV